jgi:predicted transcriptional regulator
MANFDNSGRRGRPPKEIKTFNRTRIYGSFIEDRLITPDEALELVQTLEQELWTYKQLAKVVKRKKSEAMQIMNDLVHYGLMIYQGREGRTPVFKLCKEGIKRRG